MINLILGFGAIAALWWLARLFATANPAAVAGLIRRVGGWAALAVAALLVLRGRIDIAIFVGMFGAGLLGWSGIPGLPGFRLPGWASRTRRTPGTTSRVRSAAVEMELDHATGTLQGSVLVGPEAGRPLAELSRERLLALREHCLAVDLEGAQLLEAYLDRRFPGWREDAEVHPHPGARSRPEGGPMTEEEAYQILGLHRGSGPEEVRRAHRTLMKKLHPDQGGSGYLAARVNAAKDLLLNRHR